MRSAPPPTNWPTGSATPVVTDSAGLRCVSVERSRAFIAEQAAVLSRAAQRLTESAAKHEAEHARMIAHIKAIQQRPASGNAFADMLGDHLEDRWEHAAAQRHDMTSDRLTYHPVNERQS